MPQTKFASQQQQRKNEAVSAQVAGATAPEASGRVVIESVWPEIDGGRTAVKRIIHDWLEVSADIFSDGHEIVMAELLYRSSDTTDWRHVPMHKGDNDRWSGRFKVDRIIPYFYTIEAWRDPYASWADATRNPSHWQDESQRTQQRARCKTRGPWQHLCRRGRGGRAYKYPSRARIARRLSPPCLRRTRPWHRNRA
jgi:hypothetical protein